MEIGNLPGFAQKLPSSLKSYDVTSRRGQREIGKKRMQSSSESLVEKNRPLRSVFFWQGLQDGLDGRLQGKEGGIDDHSIPGRDERGRGSALILPIPLLHVLKERIEVCIQGHGFELQPASSRPLFRISVQEKFRVSIREHHGSHIPTFRHQAVIVAYFPLQVLEPFSDDRQLPEV